MPARAPVSKWIRRPSSRASAWRGSHSASRTRWCAAATRFSTIPHGTRGAGALAEPALLRRVRRVCLWRRVYVRNFGVRHQVWADALGDQRFRRLSRSSLRRPILLDFTGTSAGAESNFKQGRVQQFNFNVEHQLPGQIVLTAGYAGSRSSHHSDRREQHQRGISGRLWNGAGIYLGLRSGRRGFRCSIRRPSLFPPLRTSLTTGRLTTIRLQIKAETKSERYGIYALLGYTYARAYDNGLTDGLGTPLGRPTSPCPTGSSLIGGCRKSISIRTSRPASFTSLPFGKGKKFGNNWSAPANAVVGNWEVTAH